MIIDPTQEITLYDLLRQREHSFVQIYEYEQRIESLLGQPYSGLVVPALPSTAKKKRKPVKKATSKKRVIRRLKPETEDAYLVSYKFKGNSCSEVLREYRLVQLLIKNDIPNIQLENISTIYYTTDDEYDLVIDLR